MSATARRPGPVAISFLLLPAWTLLRREIVRFLRQRNRIIGALGTPIVFWVIIGSGVGRSFQAPGVPDGMTYLQYFFPGTILLIVLFTSIFATISIIEDRREGFLQAVLAAPVARAAIVLGKVFGGTALATLQGGIFLALAPLAGLSIPLANVPALIGLLLLVGTFLTALGYLMAWPLDSTAGFHALMNLILMPLWLLSGALFPAEGASPWIQAVIYANPLHYALVLLRAGIGSPLPGDSGIVMSLAILIGFALALLAAATWLTQTYKGKHA